ncbi:MAG: class I tRNA ligase family protein, partial [Nitrosopumilus sp.]
LYDFVLSDKTYTIDTPPPYPSGRPWHIGAASHYSQIDMIARTARMSGKNVYFPIGIDRNGLPVELYTEKKHKIRMRETERGEFLNLCKDALDDLEAEMIQIMRSLGISGDIKNHYRTDSEEYRILTQSTFIELWKKGQIYLATRPNNYDWVSGTTIADAEITYLDLPTKLVYMKFSVMDSDMKIIIASTRPELLCACRTIIVNEEDERYSNLIGKKVIVPITNQEVEIRTHHSAQKEFGSGAVMVCSYGD